MKVYEFGEADKPVIMLFPEPAVIGNRISGM